MTDSELLSLAARAHGGLEYVPEMGWIHVSPDGTRGAWWNPLTDNGDAFALMVKLGIALMHFPLYETPKHSVVAKQCRLLDLENKGNPTEVVVLYEDDPYAATREAIVSAAASIGKEAQ